MSNPFAPPLTRPWAWGPQGGFGPGAMTVVVAWSATQGRLEGAGRRFVRICKPAGRPKAASRYSDHPCPTPRSNSALLTMW